MKIVLYDNLTAKLSARGWARAILVDVLRKILVMDYSQVPAR